MKDTDRKQNILISACLLGERVRYNGTDLFIEHPLLRQWQGENRLIAICPEVAGGMSIPRAPAEIIAGSGQSVLTKEASVMDNTGQDVTQAFLLGAQKALKTAKNNHCVVAILTERSPSCGHRQIYDGSFSGVRKLGMGVTSALLEANGIRVFNQHELQALNKFLQND